MVKVWHHQVSYKQTTSVVIQWDDANPIQQIDTLRCDIITGGSVKQCTVVCMIERLRITILI